MKKKNVGLMVCVLAIALITNVAQAQDITTGLIAHWKLDETSGTTAYDSAGSNDGTLVGSPAWGPGKVDGALDFPGGTHYVDCGNDTSLDITGSRSVAAWIKIDNWASALDPTDSWDAIVSKGDAEGNFDLLRNRLADAMAFYVAGATAVRGSIPVKDGQWHLAVGVYDNPAGLVSLYIDGVLDVSASVAPNLVIGVNTANVRINGIHVPGDPSYDDRRHIDGMIDDARIYNRALSVGDIQALVPEPATMVLLGIGSLALLKRRRA
jgi:Concanavalin A-like lectin/glucanases superfamily/PEP-CTERM motif